MLIFLGIFAIFTEAGLGTFDLPALYAHGQDGGFDTDFQKWVFPLFAIGCGVPGRPVALPHLVARRPRRRRRPPSRCSTPAC